MATYSTKCLSICHYGYGLHIIQIWSTNIIYLSGHAYCRKVFLMVVVLPHDWGAQIIYNKGENKIKDTLNIKLLSKLNNHISLRCENVYDHMTQVHAFQHHSLFEDIHSHMTQHCQNKNNQISLQMSNLFYKAILIKGHIITKQVILILTIITLSNQVISFKL